MPLIPLAAAAPSEPWRTAAPEGQGFSSAKLEALRADLAARQTRAFLVIRNDAIVCEWYAPDQGPTMKHGTASLAKAIVGGLSVAVAMTDGRLALDDPAARFVPQWREDPRKSKITLRQLGSHTSGIEDAEADDKPHDQLPGWKGDFWKRLPVPDDPFTIARDRAPLAFAPGERMQYSNPGIALMTWCVTATLRDAPQKDIRSLLRERVMRPIGVADADWSVGYGQTFTVNGLPLVPSWGGGSYTARAAARVGRLMLRSGDWDGQRLLSAEAVRLTTSDAGTPSPCGIGWWSNQEGDCPKLPRDAFFGSGAGHQILLVVPSLNLVVVRFGALLAKVATDPKSYHDAYRRFLFEPLMEGITDPAFKPSPHQGQATNVAPHPATVVSSRLKEAPKDTIVRKTHDYFPPSESQGGWRKLGKEEDIRRLAGMDPLKLDQLREWLLKSDDRKFAAVVIRNGYIVLEVERGNNARTDTQRVASVSKAVCATVLAIASEQSQQGRTPRRMTFDDPAFEFIPWAQPLSDPRKARITVKQLLNHTSGICPEATGAPNDGSWEYILGHSGDARTARLAFDPGTACGYSSHALAHAALVCETVTGKPYDQFAIEALLKPLGIEHWWFQYYEGGEKIGRHPSHGLGMPARDLARIAYCMLRGGRWGEQQVIPKWFVEETAAPTHDVTTPEMRWKFSPRIFSNGWELPARHTGGGGRTGEGIPADARSKPGSGGQLIAFVPSLDLVVTRQTGSSGEWEFDDYLRRACAAVLP